MADNENKNYISVDGLRTFWNEAKNRVVLKDGEEVEFDKPVTFEDDVEFDEKVTIITEPYDPTDAVNKEYVDDNYLPLNGGCMSGDIDMDGQAIVNLLDPVNDGDAATKGYVDSKQQWSATVNPDADISYISIILNDSNQGCILAIDSVSGGGAFHGILCIDTNFDINAAVFAGSGGIDISVAATSGYDNTYSPTRYIAVLKYLDDQPVTITCIAGTPPLSAHTTDVLSGETFTSTRVWTNLEAGVRYDVSQSLSSAQKSRARNNIGASAELTFDSTPTQGSSNPVTSNGIKTYVDNLAPVIVDGSIGSGTFTPDSNQPSWTTAYAAFKSGRNVILRWSNANYSSAVINATDDINHSLFIYDYTTDDKYAWLKPTS